MDLQGMTDDEIKAQIEAMRNELKAREEDRIEQEFQKIAHLPVEDLEKLKLKIEQKIQNDRSSRQPAQKELREKISRNPIEPGDKEKILKAFGGKKI